MAVCFLGLFLAVALMDKAQAAIKNVVLKVKNVMAFLCRAIVPWARAGG